MLGYVLFCSEITLLIQLPSKTNTSSEQGENLSSVLSTSCFAKMGHSWKAKGKLPGKSLEGYRLVLVDINLPPVSFSSPEVSTPKTHGVAFLSPIPAASSMSRFFYLKLDLIDKGQLLISTVNNQC